MKKRFQLRSIRTQLPFSYAGIALLVTTLVGAVMMLILGNYYRQMEIENLALNAQSIAGNLSHMAMNNDFGSLNSDVNNPNFFQDQARAEAFLIQARVRILDSEKNILADSGTPIKDWYITIPQNAPTESSSTVISGNQVGQNPIFISPGTGGPPPARGGGGGNSSISFYANSNMFGFILQDSNFVEGKRFSYTSMASFTDQNGNILGYVELSDSPDYGGSIIQNVIQGWLIASLITLIVSILIGWWMSRRLANPIDALEKVAVEMKEGNYAIRAGVLKPDELASLSDTFNQMADRIQNNIGTLREFVSDAAHEIRTPLTALRADLNLALTGEDAETSRELVNRSLEQVNRLETLSRELLDLSIIESQPEGSNSRQIDLLDLLMKTSEVHASVAEQAGIDFQVHLPGGEFFVKGNEAQLRRAISNVLENAVKFTPTGGQVTLNLKQEGLWAILLVEDNGIGIPGEERPFLFNRFHRGRNASTYPGSGLGLAIAKVIVENHHGEIGLLPVEDKTTFYIKLPLIIEV